MRITLDVYVQRLIEISVRKCKLLEEMLLLTKDQTRAITEEEMEELEKLIGQKQTRIDAINKLDEEFEVYFRRLKSELKVKSLDELSGSGIKEVKELQDSLKRIMSLITEISSIEKLNSAKAKELQSRFGSEIKKINQGKKMTSAYMPSPSKPPSYFIDKKK